MKLEKRVRYIDIAKLIAILFVLLDHMQYHITVGNKFMTFRVIWLSFFLQIFFISAGITGNFNDTNSLKNIKKYILKKFQTLLIPYILWCFLLNNTGNHQINFFLGILLGNVDGLEYAGINSILWFLPSFFGAYIFTFFVLWFCQKFHNKKILLLFFIIGLLYLQKILCLYIPEYLYFGLKSAFAGSALMLSGYLLKNIVLSLENYSTLKKCCISLGGGILSTIGAYINMPVLFEEKVFIGYKSSVWMAQGFFGKSMLLFLLVGIGYSIVLFVIATFLDKLLFLSYLGERTLLFMMIHNYTHPIMAVNILPTVLGICSNHLVNQTIFMIGSIFLIIIIIPFIDKFMPFLYKQTTRS